MNAFAVLIAVSTVGVEYGWQPTGDGQLEYIIQIEPALLEAIREGEEIISEIHPDVAGVRRFRVRVGSGIVPQEGIVPPTDTKPPPPDPSSSFPPQDDPSPASDFPTGGGSLPNNDVPAEKAPWEQDPLPGGLILPPDGESDSTQFQGAGSAAAQEEQEAPERMLTDPLAEPLPNRTASFDEPSAGTSQAELIVAEPPSPEMPTPQLASKPVTQDPERPWQTLTLVGLLLFGSVGLNLYLGWIMRGIYLRYRTLREQMRSAGTAGT